MGRDQEWIFTNGVPSTTTKREEITSATTQRIGPARRGLVVIYVGIDPGLTGAVAFIDGDRISIEDIPTREVTGGAVVRKRVNGLELARMLRRHCPADKAALVTIEAVHAIAGKREGQGGMQQMGSLERTSGAIEAVLEVLRMPFVAVYPQSWKRLYELSKDKDAARSMAMRLYPDAQAMLARKKDHNRAESLLIAHYGLTKGEQ